MFRYGESVDIGVLIQRAEDTSAAGGGATAGKIFLQWFAFLFLRRCSFSL